MASKWTGKKGPDAVTIYQTYTRATPPAPIDYSLVYVGLKAIGRKPAWGIADYDDARVLLDLGAGDLLRPTPGTPRDKAIADLIAFLSVAAG